MMKAGVIAFHIALLSTSFWLLVGGIDISHQNDIWKRARTPPPLSPSRSSDSVEVYSPVRPTDHIYEDAYFEPFQSYHDPNRWTPPPSSPLPDKPKSPIKEQIKEEILTKPKRKYTRKSSTTNKQEKVSWFMKRLNLYLRAARRI
jgi:hypothetical protein